MTLQGLRINSCVDYDDVITDTVPAILEYYWHRTNRRFVKEDVWTYDLWDVWGCTREESGEIVSSFYNSDFFDNLNPCPGAIDALHTLAQCTSPHIATARSMEFRSKSEKFLQHHLPNHFIPIYHAAGYYPNVEQGRARNKGEICMDLGACVMIDDHPTFSYQCAQAGIFTYLIDQPWNQNTPAHPLLMRVKGGLAEAVERYLTQPLKTAQTSDKYGIAP